MSNGYIGSKTSVALYDAYTQDQVDGLVALGDAAVNQNIENHINSESAHDASDIVYDNAGSGLASANMKAAIDELVEDVSEKVALADFLNGNQSLSSNGYQKLPGGLIIQWGQASGSAQEITANYPISFPNQAFRRAVTLTDKSGGASIGMTVYSVQSLNTNSQIGARLSGYDSGTWTIHYIAIGY